MGAAAPSPRVLLTRPLVDSRPLGCEGDRLACMPLGGRHESDAAVAVPVVVPVQKTPSPRLRPPPGCGRGAWGSWV